MVAGAASRLKQLMEEAVAFSMEHVQEGGIPFTAFVVDHHGQILGRGVNRVRAYHDPTAHAEVEAIRDACRRHSMTHLAGATLFASGEPCAMCYVSARSAGISQIFFAVGRDEAAAHGFDYRGSYHLFADDPRTWLSPEVSKLEIPEGLHPFLAFCPERRAP